MAAEVLADTGSLLALLDHDDHWHEACAAAFDTLPLPLITSAAVLTELFHLVGDNKRERAAAWRLIRSGAITIRDIADEDLGVLDRLMEKYADRPMDFADATLVYLAEREQLTRIFTVNHSDFSTYRINGRKHFTIIPARAR